MSVTITVKYKPDEGDPNGQICRMTFELESTARTAAASMRKNPDVQSVEVPWE